MVGDVIFSMSRFFLEIQINIHKEGGSNEGFATQKMLSIRVSSRKMMTGRI